jgi:hypothetical protein
MWSREKIFEVVNVVGSVASVIGFAVLIVGWFATPMNRDPEQILWQYIGFITALLASAAIVVLFFLWIVNGLSRFPANSGMGVAVICLKLCLGVVALGIAVDGMISSVRWMVWPRIPMSFFHFWWDHIFY